MIYNAKVLIQEPNQEKFTTITGKFDFDPHDEVGLISGQSENGIKTCGYVVEVLTCDIITENNIKDSDLITILKRNDLFLNIESEIPDKGDLLYYKNPNIENDYFRLGVFSENMIREYIKLNQLE